MRKNPSETSPTSSDAAPDKQKNPHGREYTCTIARHLRTLGQQAIWHQIERFANVSTIAKKNQGKAPEHQEPPIFFASIATLADACNCAYNTARAAVAEFVRQGLLTPADHELKYRPHKENGRYQTRTFNVMTHDFYAQFDPCPAYRFARRDGTLRVKDEEKAGWTADLNENFGRRRQSSETLILARAVIELRETPNVNGNGKGNGSGNANARSFGEIGKRLGIGKGYACKLYHRYQHMRYGMNDLIRQAEDREDEEQETVS